MKQNWSSEDFSDVTRNPRAVHDFWDPMAQGTDRALPGEKKLIALPILVAGPIELNHSARGRWVYEDFEGTRRTPAKFVDPWEDYVATVAPAGVKANSDFWDPAPIVARAIASSGVEDWSENISLPRYDPVASERPFSSYYPEPPESLAEKRARWMFSILGITNPSRHRSVFDAFTDLFIEYPHHSTFKTLSNLALDDATADELVCAFTLKQIWHDFPIFSSLRTKRRDVVIASDAASLLGWTLAVRLVRQSRGAPPERIIDPDWFDEWLAVPYADPLYWRFIDYICARIESVDSGALETPPTTRSFILPLKDLGIDGFSPFNNFSRTSLLMRTYADCVERSFVDQTADDDSKK